MMMGVAIFLALVMVKLVYNSVASRLFSEEGLFLGETTRISWSQEAGFLVEFGVVEFEDDSRNTPSDLFSAVSRQQLLVSQQVAAGIVSSAIEEGVRLSLVSNSN